MHQLINPNYKIPYYGGLCEGFVEGTVGQATLPAKDNNGHYQTYGVYPTAAASWAANKGNHPGELPPTGVKVAVHFTLGNNKDGHVALSLEDGRVASSTQPGYHTTAYIHPSLQDLIDVYAKYNNGCVYIGWSEYIGNLRVVEGENMPPVSEQKPDALTIQLNYNLGADRQPTDEEVKGWGDSGYSVEQLGRTLLESPEHKELMRLVGVGRAYEKGELTGYVPVTEQLYKKG